MLNEEETDQTGGESLQEPITANGSQPSAAALPVSTPHVQKGEGLEGRKVAEAEEEGEQQRD